MPVPVELICKRISTHQPRNAKAKKVSSQIIKEVSGEASNEPKRKLAHLHKKRQRLISKAAYALCMEPKLQLGKLYPRLDVYGNMFHYLVKGGWVGISTQLKSSGCYWGNAHYTIYVSNEILND